MEKPFREIFQSLVEGPKPSLTKILHYMPMGKDRRALIKKHFEENPEARISVNARWTRQVKLDSDLKFLIKRGFLKQTKDRYFSGVHHKTYLIKA
jgi:predicted AAA+ superfamily ATPase